LEQAAADARIVARDLLEALDQLHAVRSYADAIRRRHGQYARYHAGHCFKADGQTRSGVDAPAFRGRAGRGDTGDACAA
jgi:hypothetical protein